MSDGSETNAEALCFFQPGMNQLYELKRITLFTENYALTCGNLTFKFINLSDILRMVSEMQMSLTVFWTETETFLQLLTSIIALYFGTIFSNYF